MYRCGDDAQAWQEVNEKQRNEKSGGLAEARRSSTELDVNGPRVTEILKSTSKFSEIR